jgi:hypothetical protein
MTNKTTAKNFNGLVKSLKESEEDFEFYPTTKKMIRCIFNAIHDTKINILDIGCGTCNFKRFYEELSKEKYTREIAKEQDKYRVYLKSIRKYYVIEKSKILLDQLDKDTIVLGTDFHDSQLIDKPVEAIFCNPPYQEFKHWMIRIINEGNCFDLYLVIPERWKEDNDIQALLTEKELNPNVLGSFDFLDAERRSRAKVDILHIAKKTKGYHTTLDEIEKSAFETWFDETFNFQGLSREEEKLSEYERSARQKEELKNRLILTGEKSKARTLVLFYEEELNTLFNNFQAICSMDAEVLETIGISKESIIEAIKQKTVNLKTLYWGTIFDELEEITSRLTSTTRDEMFERFKELRTVEFTEPNIYSLVIWILKNANTYYNDQLVKFYRELSSHKNVTPYKSNIKTFANDEWRFNNEKNTHYTLDYRIICRNYLLGCETGWRGELQTGYKYNEKITDIKVIFNNLGFPITYTETPTYFGEKCYAHGHNDEKMFEFKVYKNGNVHLKLNIEFTKAMNVEVSRLLGWIRTKEDIKTEFTGEMAKGAEKYFKTNQQLLVSNGTKLLADTAKGSSLAEGC